MNPYEILGVSETASDKEIRSAYLKLVLELHPDVTQEDQAKQERLKKVNAANDILRDPALKAEVDEKFRQQRARQQPTAHTRPPQSGAPQPSGSARPNQGQSRPAATAQPMWEGWQQFAKQQPGRAQAPQSADSPLPSTGDNGFWGKVLVGFGFGALIVAAARGSSTTWDPNVKRNRGPDGRFRP